MSSDLIIQNNAEASRYDQDFSDFVQNAREEEAVDFMDSFGGDKAAAPPAPMSPEGKDDPAENSPGFMRDISLGVLHSPRSALRGANKAASNIIGLLDDMDTLIKRAGGIENKQVTLPTLPVVVDPPTTETVTGSIIENIAQFAVGFKGVDKIGKVLGLAGKTAGAGKAAQVAATSGKGAAADMLAFDEQDARLSNMVADLLPEDVGKTVEDYMGAQADDGFVEGKMKQAIEGMALGVAGEVLVDGIKLLKRGKAAKDGLKNENIDDLFDVPDEEAARLGVDAKNFEFLGKADSEDLWLRKQQKLDAAEAEVQGAYGKPKQVGQGAAESIDDYEINFARIEGPDDIKQLMDDMVNKPELKPSIEAARRGKQDWRQTLTAATDIDGFDSLMSRRVGEAFNSDQIIAGRKVYYDTTAKVMEAAKKAAAPEASDIDQFNLRKLIALHHAVQKEFMGIRAEAGRALQAWNIPVGGTSSENVRALEQVLNEFGGAAASKDLAKRISKIGNKLNTSQLNMITQKAATARTVDAVAEAWTLGLLTNPTTHVVNISSNVLTGLFLGAERAASAFAKDSPVTLREAGEFFTAYLENQKLAFKNGAEAFRTGQVGHGLSKLDLPRTRMTARDVLDPEGKAGILSKGMDGWGAMLSKYAGGALAFGDEYAKTLLYQSQMRALAMRQGLAQGLDGEALTKHIADVLADPPSVMRADAVEFANYGTFTNQLGKTGQDLQRAIARHPELRFIVPFVRTPANIFKFTFARTPLGILSKKAREDISAGGLRRATQLSRIGMGTSIMAIGADLAQNGTITGSGPTDPSVRAGLRRTGWQPYSIKIGDTYYSYSRFEPLATVLGMSADLAEILSNYESYDIDAQSGIEELGTAAVVAISNQLIGKTFMSGFADTVEMLSDPGRYGEGYLQRFAGSFVPAGGAALERAINPEMEQVFNMMDAIKARIPGASEFVPKRRNIWGEEIAYFHPNEKSIAGATAERILSLFNPVYYSAEADAPLDRWMLKNGFQIGMPDKRQMFEGSRIDLRDHPFMYERLVQLRGNEIKLPAYGNQTMKEFFTNLSTESDPYGKHIGFFLDLGGNSFDDQQNFISQVVRDYQAAAREQLMQEFDELPGLIAKERRNTEMLNSVRGSLQETGDANGQ